MSDRTHIAIHPRSQKAWLWYLSGALTFAWGYQLLPTAGLMRPVGYVLVPASAAVCLLTGILRHGPTRRLAWVVLLTGQLCQVIGVSIWRVVAEVQDVEWSYPNASDAFFLLGYIGYFIALTLLVRTRTARDRANFIDAAVVTTGLASLAWVFVMSPVLADTTVPVPARLTSLAYPLVLLVILSVLMRFGFSFTRRTTSIRLLIAAAVTGLVGDIAFAFLAEFAAGSLIDSVWLSAYAFLGAAALHPSMAEDASLSAAPFVGVGRRRMILLAVAALMAPVALVVQPSDTVGINTIVIAGAAGLMFLLVLGRMEGLVKHLRRTEAERHRLLDKVVQATEQERERIASQLHDAPIQRLASTSYRLETVAQRIRKGATAEAEELLNEVHTDLTTEIDGLRQMMATLRPPSLDHAGLEGAIQDAARAFTQQTGVPCTVAVENMRPLRREFETTLFRIATEALRNAALHARCNNASITIREDANAIEFTMSDDGVGFDPNASVPRDAFGIASMRQQAEMFDGRLDIDSSREHGTHLRVRFAVDTQAA